MKKEYSIKEIEEIIKENNILKQRADVVDDFLIITKTDKKGLITYSNRSFEKISGYSKEELMGKPHNIVRHPDVPKRFFEALWNRISKKKEIWRGVVKNMAKNGETYYVESYISPIFDHRGNIIEYISLRKDITKRVEREKELNSEKRFVESILNYQDSITILTNEENGMLYANKKFFEFVDFESIDDFKKVFDCVGELFIPEEKLIYSCAIEWIEHIYKNPDEVHKTKLMGQDGKVHYFSIRADKIEASTSRAKRFGLKNRELYLLTLNDITDLEIALQKANAGIETKSRFLANMSHEIRTPLNGILGFTDLLKKGRLTLEQEKYLNTISSSGKTLLGIINDILDFSKVESGKMSLEAIKFDPINELEPTINIFNAKMVEKKIEYLPFIDPTLPKWIILDPLRLKQVLSNLIGNALKFTPENGRVDVEIVSERISEERINLSISIQDSGIGISHEQQKKIFTPFSQADESTTRKFGGTGLGLSISKSFIELMGGNLKVNSELGKGSKFFFKITDIQASSENSIEFKRWSDGLKNSIFISSGKKITGEIELLQKYLKAFGTDVSIERDFEKLKDSQIIWITSSTIEESDLKLVKRDHRNIPVVVIENDDNRVSHLLSSRKDILRIVSPFNMSSIYESLMSSLDIEFEKSILDQSSGKCNFYFKDKRVLVAEDNEVNQMFIDILLKGYNISADIVENGEEAFNSFKNRDYDLILMDINMPVLGGIEATKKIRELNVLGSRIPIIALTANALLGDREKFLAEGMSDYLTKPIEVKELERVLKRYLGGGSEKDSRIIEKENIYTKNNISNKGVLMISVPENSFEPISKALISSELGLPEMFIDKLIGKFLEGLDKSFEDLKSAIENRNSEDIKNFAHKLKGSSANLRFKYLAELLKVIEYSGKDGVVDGFDELLDEIKKEIEVIRNFAKA